MLERMKWKPKYPHSVSLWFPFGAFLLFLSPTLFAESINQPNTHASKPFLLEKRFAGLTDNIPELLLKTVNNKIAGHISAQNFDYEAPSTVTLYGVAIKAPDGSSVIKVRRLKISLSVKALFSGALQFEEISIKEPTINLVSKNGLLNIERAFKTKTIGTAAKDDEAPLSIHVEKLSLQKVNIFEKKDLF